MDSHLLVTPAIFKPGSTVFKNMDSREKISRITNDVDVWLKILGMTNERVPRLFFSFPLEGRGLGWGWGWNNYKGGAAPLINPLKKEKNIKTKRKSESVDASLNFRHDERGIIPECLYHPLISHSWMVLSSPSSSPLNVFIRGLNQGRGNPPFSVIARSDWGGNLAFLSLKKLKSKLDRVKSSGLPRKRNHELAMTPCRHPGNF